MKPTVKQIAELAKEAEITDSIDWGSLKITEKHAYEMMASNVLEQFENLSEDQQMTVAMATITKLLVENFVLNIKLQGK
jgi:hypothetical protein